MLTLHNSGLFDLADASPRSYTEAIAAAKPFSGFLYEKQYMS
jgi:hypothetical protein